jgi:hypothetical protein
MLKRDDMRVIMLLTVLTTMSACSRYDPIPQGEIVTCNVGQGSGAGTKGCG